MLLAQDDKTIHTLAPDRSDQSFGKAVLPRRGRRRRFVPDAHGAHASRDNGAIDPISIPDQVARSPIPRECLLYWGVWCQARQTFPPIWFWCRSQGSGFSSGSALRPSHDGIRRMRRNDLGDVLAVRLTEGTRHSTNSPHPSSLRGTSLHQSAEFKFAPIALNPVRLSCRRNFFPRPAKLSAVNPHPMHDDGHSSCYGDDRALHSSTPGYLHAPGLEP